MTVQRGIDVAIQTDGQWQDARDKKYKRMKRQILQFIAKHKSAQLSVDQANRKLKAVQKEKRQLSRQTSQMDEDEEEEAEDDAAEDEDEEEEVDQLVDEEDEITLDMVTTQTARPRHRTPRGRKVTIPRDENGNIQLPFQISSLNVISLGKVVYDRKSFHCDRYIWPVGYCVERTYMSMVKPNHQTTYTCRVEDSGDGPLFTIRAADAPDEEISAKTPTGAWGVVIKRANEIRHRECTNAISGPEYFGFSHPLVIAMIQELDGVDKCENYVRRVDHDA